jgi:hypothetical protein
VPRSETRPARYDAREALTLDGLVQDGSSNKSFSSSQVRPSLSRLEILQLRAWTRAKLWQACELDLHEAVDPLQHYAVESGLVALIGQDAVQAIIATPFARVRP